MRQEEDGPYKAGFGDGVRAYAHWRDGKQEVGTTGTTLSKALAEVEGTWNYRHEVALFDRTAKAAPDLLRALRLAYDDLEWFRAESLRGGGDQRAWLDADEERWKIMRAAIAQVDEES